MTRFLAKKPWFSYMLLGITLVHFWYGYIFNDYNLIGTIFCSVGVTLIYLSAPRSAAIKLMNKAAKKLNGECDPYPLLLEVEDQLTYVKNAGIKQLCMLNRAVALSCIGRYAEAYELQNTIDINMLSGTNLITKAIYYTNLSSFALDIGKFDESVSYHAKASQIAALIKNKKLKESAFPVLRLISAEQAILGKNFKTAIELISSVEDKTKRTSVAKAFLYGKIALEQGDKEGAKANLLYVVNNGNKLSYVEEARALLVTL